MRAMSAKRRETLPMTMRNEPRGRLNSLFLVVSMFEVMEGEVGVYCRTMRFSSIAKYFLYAAMSAAVL